MTRRRPLLWSGVVLLAAGLVVLGYVGWQLYGTTVVSKHRLAMNDGDACLAGCLAGLGIAHLPTFMVQSHVASGELVIVLGEYLSDNFPMYALYPQNRHLSSKVRVFIDWIAELFDNSDLLQNRSTFTRPAPGAPG